MKKLLTLLSIPVIISLNGCSDNLDEYFYKQKEYGNVVLTTWNDGMGTHFRAERKENIGALGSYIHSIDNAQRENKYGDGRFDKITLLDVPKGDILEKYANIDTIAKYAQEVKETGYDCNQ